MYTFIVISAAVCLIS